MIRLALLVVMLCRISSAQTPSPVPSAAPARTVTFAATSVDEVVQSLFERATPADSSSCNSIHDSDLENLCKGSCNNIHNSDLENACKGSCNSIHDGDLENACKGADACNSIHDNDLENLCKGSCNNIHDSDVENLCKGSCNNIHDSDLENACKGHLSRRAVAAAGWYRKHGH
jgi:mRNA deadenylase 3'-5' endonuclease subunit Ccr4